MMTMCLCWINIYMNNLQMDDVSGPSWSPDNSRYSYFNVKSSGHPFTVPYGPFRRGGRILILLVLKGKEKKYIFWG